MVGPGRDVGPGRHCRRPGPRDGDPLGSSARAPYGHSGCGSRSSHLQDGGTQRYFAILRPDRGPSVRYRRCWRSLGARLGANDHSYRATPGHVQPLRLELNGTSSDIQHYRARFRKCLLSSRSRVRVAVGPHTSNPGQAVSRRRPGTPSRCRPAAPCPLRARWLRLGPAQLLRCLPAQLGRDGMLSFGAAVQVDGRGPGRGVPHPLHQLTRADRMRPPGRSHRRHCPVRWRSAALCSPSSRDRRAAAFRHRGSRCRLLISGQRRITLCSRAEGG